jgi:putative aldouronate transport system permease protein
MEYTCELCGAADHTYNDDKDPRNLEGALETSTFDPATIRTTAAPRLSLASAAHRIRKHWGLYVLAAPGVAYLLIFHVFPIYGLQLAFKDYSIRAGILRSPWVGLDHFRQFFTSWGASKIIINTVVLSAYDLAVGLPINIAFALCLNWVANQRYKRIVQTVTYAPHFISMVVVVGMMSILFNPTTGPINMFIEALGGDSIYFFGRKELFRHLFVWSSRWQNTGWGAVIYLAALSSVNPELYESARIDGATKPQLIWHIDIPTIKPTIIVVSLLAIGRVMTLNFEKVLLMQTPLNTETSEIIQTFVYKVGLENFQVGYGTAIGLFNSVINATLLLAFNTLSRRLSKESLW